MHRQKGFLSDNEVYRLPTEAEWEFAARGGNKSKNCKFSGCARKNINDFVWYCGNTKKVQKVGLKKANELGFHDMSGNVWEWTDDCYSAYPAYPVVDPTELHRGQSNVIRGGSWNALSNFCYVFTRSNAAPDRRMPCLGFRVLKTIAY
jgi:formylglycine-generating enzyme required for sulfatase activity